MKEQKVIVLAGNPNVGKSTVFNRLTGGKQHTGNWTGKTVEISEGICETEHCVLHIADLPGTYSLDSHSPEEEIAGKYLMEEEFDAAVVICDGTCLERNLNLVFQIMELTSSVMLVVNLMDEADKKGICMDLAKLEKTSWCAWSSEFPHYSRDSIKELRKFLERAGEQKTPRIPASNVRERMKQAERICSQTVFAAEAGRQQRQISGPAVYRKEDRTSDHVSDACPDFVDYHSRSQSIFRCAVRGGFLAGGKIQVVSAAGECAGLVSGDYGGRSLPGGQQCDIGHAASDADFLSAVFSAGGFRLSAPGGVCSGLPSGALQSVRETGSYHVYGSRV